MKRITILGAGDPLLANEGFGIRAVEMLRQRYIFSRAVTLTAAGPESLALLVLVEQADVLIILDAVDCAMESGALFLADDDDVPRCLASEKASLHQSAMLDALETARLSGRLPLHIRLVGVQPLGLENYDSISEPVRAQIEGALAETISYLARFGVNATPRVARFSRS
jgi:hydrogenase maturation protease